MTKYLIVILIVLAVLVACNQGYIVNIEKRTDYTGGREMYISKCNACHQLYNPDKYTKTTWDSILITMSLKAKINKEQSDQIYNWILEIKNDSIITSSEK